MGGQFKKRLSKYRGVTKHKGMHRWSAFTGGGNNLQWHGTYETENEAARVRNKMMLERFGSDPEPNVIEGSEECVARYSVSGGIEFIIRAINSMRLHGGGTLHVLKHAGETEFALRGRIRVLTPLLRAQPYISDVIVASNASCNVNLNECELDIGGPWLSVPAVGPSARILFHRKQNFKGLPIYHWRKIAKKYLGNYGYVGDSTGAQLLRTATRIHSMPLFSARNLFQAAQIISGAELFVGNQSPMLEIAKGLGINTVLEGTKEFDELAILHYLDTTPVSPTQSSTAREAEQYPESRNA